MQHPQTIYVGIIDNDESVCRSLGRLLRADQLQPITYPAAEAFLADTKRPKFDCLVLALQLRGMSGLELSERLSAVKEGTPIIFIAAGDEPEARAQAEAAGCAGYLRKTDSPAVILAAVRRAAGLEDSASTPRK